MAHVIANRVKETTTTAGTTNFTLNGPETGFQSFSVIGNGNTTYYAAVSDSQWEVGIGTYTSSGTVLSRDTILASSSSGSKVNFSAGIKEVFVSLPSEATVFYDGTSGTSGQVLTSQGSGAFPKWETPPSRNAYAWFIS
jgi:hypothetical protein